MVYHIISSIETILPNLQIMFLVTSRLERIAVKRTFPSSQNTASFVNSFFYVQIMADVARRRLAYFLTVQYCSFPLLTAHPKCILLIVSTIFLCLCSSFTVCTVICLSFLQLSIVTHVSISTYRIVSTTTHTIMRRRMNRQRSSTCNRINSK